MSVKQILIAICILLLFSTSLLAQDKIQITSSTFGTLEARQIGPAVMSGRITAIDEINNLAQAQERNLLPIYFVINDSFKKKISIPSSRSWSRL